MPASQPGERSWVPPRPGMKSQPAFGAPPANREMGCSHTEAPSSALAHGSLAWLVQGVFLLSVIWSQVSCWGSAVWLPECVFAVGGGVQYARHQSPPTNYRIPESLGN